MARTNCKSSRASRKYLHRGRNKPPPPVSTYRTDRPSVTQGRKRRWRCVLHALIPGERKAITAAASQCIRRSFASSVPSICVRACAHHLLCFSRTSAPPPPSPSVQTLHGQAGCSDVRGNPDKMCRACGLRDGGQCMPHIPPSQHPPIFRDRRDPQTGRRLTSVVLVGGFLGPTGPAICELYHNARPPEQLRA